MFLMRQSHLQWHVYWSLLCNAHKLVLPDINLRNKTFASLTQVFKLLLGLWKYWRLLWYWRNGWLNAFKVIKNNKLYNTILKYNTIPYHTIPYHTIPYHTVPYICFQKTSDKICLVPTLFPLLTMLKKWTKLASSFVMGFQHCIGGEGVVLNTLFKITIIFCHWL